MGRIRWLLPFKEEIGPNEWTLCRKTIDNDKSNVTNNDRKVEVDYYYVEHGFFKLRTNQNSIILGALHVLVMIGFYELFTKALWDLLIVGK